MTRCRFWRHWSTKKAYSEAGVSALPALLALLLTASMIPTSSSWRGGREGGEACPPHWSTLLHTSLAHLGEEVGNLPGVKDVVDVLEGGGCRAGSRGDGEGGAEYTCLRYIGEIRCCPLRATPLRPHIVPPLLLTSRNDSSLSCVSLKRNAVGWNCAPACFSTRRRSSRHST